MRDPAIHQPELRVPAADGAVLAVFGIEAGAAGHGAPPGVPPLLLVHGTGSDHTTWRVTGPLLAETRPVWAMDRRGRGASTDGPAYAAALEVADVAAVADALAARHGRPVGVLGHSLGGRLAIAAAAGAAGVSHVVAYESAPSPDSGDDGAALLARLREDLDRDDPGAALARFLTEGAGLPDVEVAAFRASPLWDVRLAAVPTVVRELDAGLHDPAIGADALARTSVPVLQLVGSASPQRFRDGALTLHARLAAGHLGTIEGARHNAHHTHSAVLADAVDAFLGR